MTGFLIAIGIVIGILLTNMWYGYRYRILRKEVDQLDKETRAFLLELADTMLHSENVSKNEILDLCEKYLEVRYGR